MPRKKPVRTQHMIGGQDGSTCQELLMRLSEYVDGGIDPAVCKEFEAHLAGCNPCRVVVDNVRQTITLYRRNAPCALPVAFRKRLHECLRKHWKPKKKTRPLPPG